MQLHEVFFAVAVECQRFDMPVSPASMPALEFGLKQIQSAKTREELALALMAAYPGEKLDGR